MKKFGAYKILTAESLIVEYHSGNINADQFIRSRKIITSVPEFNPDFDQVFDFRNVNAKVVQEDIKRFTLFYRKYIPLLGQRRTAYLTDSPSGVVITTIFSAQIADLPIKASVFSTLTGVVEWLKRKNIDKAFLTRIIEELKTQPNTLYP